MYCMISATPITSPAMKPPPGMLWPRSRMKTPTVSASGSSARVTTTSISGCRSPASRRCGRCPSRRPEAPPQRAVQQREDRQRRDAQHDDLAEGVVAAEVDQDHVDDVGAAAARLGMRDVPGGDGLGEIAGQHGVERGADRPVPPAAATARSRQCRRRDGSGGGLLRQVVERQQHQDGGDHLDRELGQGEVGGGEVDEGQRDHEAYDAGQDQRQQALAVVAEDRQGGGHDEQPEGHRRQVDRQHRPRARGMRRRPGKPWAPTPSITRIASSRPRCSEPL